ncbi:MAG: ABC transporter permease [Bacteroidales bacterium]|nr:ABC transporter permease [Bacteroidales bacterium]MDE7103685.1 ABC transporter permease [Bacteroidales bacterium]
MKQFWAFVNKEFLHIFRDRQTILILLLMPVVQVLLFGFAITTDIQNSSVVALDECQTAESRALLKEIESGRYFDIVQYIESDRDIDAIFKKGKVKIAIVIPQDWSRRIGAGQEAPLQLIVDASNPNEASILTGYLQGIAAQFAGLEPVLDVETRMLYNPQLKSAYTFVPGVIGLVLMLICTLMTSVSIVREKETGTMEVLLVSPSKPLYIIFSKTIPYFVIALINIVTIILLSMFVFGVPIQGSIALLFGVSITYIFASLALGLLISTVSSTQQIAMIISLMGLMLPTVLLAGLLFPIENMPMPLQWVSKIVPATWFIDMTKAIMIKGLGIGLIWKQWLILLGMTVLFIGISVSRFKIRLS